MVLDFINEQSSLSEDLGEVRFVRVTNEKKENRIVVRNFGKYTKPINTGFGGVWRVKKWK